MKHMNNRIRELRKRSGISQELLAAELNVTQLLSGAYALISPAQASQPGRQARRKQAR